jgi:2-polyprenyl-3-methyl-5-hydroxy-6-metoxy-1,4-benzoquinol methylase
VERFEKLAKEWDNNPRRVENASKIANAISKYINIDNSMEMLDYGTGTGLLALNFVDRVKSLYAFDSSKEMLKVLDEKSKDIKNLYTKQHNIEKDELEGKFDIIVSAMMLHHLKNPKIFIDKTFKSLKSGSYLCIADLSSEDGSFHSDLNGVFHFGFSDDELKELLKEFSKVDIYKVNEIKKSNKSYSVFLAIAKR